MSFSKEWNERYLSNEHMSVWPFSDLISYVKRSCNFKNGPLKVLELGCGAGANIPFFQSLHANYYALEGSEFIVKKLKSRFPEYAAHIECGDFTEEIPFDTKFDVIIDRASLTHNTTTAIKNCLNLIASHLSPNGIFIGIDWFSTEHADYNNGEKTEDPHTRKNFKEGPFSEVGLVHFSDEAHLNELFSANFVIEKLEHKDITSYRNPVGYHAASWNFLARKRG